MSPCARATFNGRRKKQAFRARRTGTYHCRCSPSQAYTGPAGGSINGAQHPKSDPPDASHFMAIRSWAAQGVHHRARGFVIGHLIDIYNPRSRWLRHQFAELHHNNLGNYACSAARPRLACCTRRLLKGNGHVTTAVTRTLCCGDPGHGGSGTRARATAKVATKSTGSVQRGDVRRPLLPPARQSPGCSRPKPGSLSVTFVGGTIFQLPPIRVDRCERQPQRAHNAPGGAPDGDNHVSPPSRAAAPCCMGLTGVYASRYNLAFMHHAALS